MSIPLIVGPAVALLGIVTIFFVLRRKSVEKRSMYSARRSQIEHKVRAARQRTLAPHGRAERPAEAPAAPAPTSIFAPNQAQQTVSYEPSAYQPPPAAWPSAPAAAPESPFQPAAPAPPSFTAPSQEASPWDVGAAPAPPTPPPFMPPPEPQPAYEPPASSTSAPAWTPGPAPSEPAGPLEPAPTGTTSPATAGWSIVSDAKDASASEPSSDKQDKKKKKEKTAATGAWSLASGDSPGTESSEEVMKKPSATMSIVLYALLVVGLITVLMGVLLILSNPHP